MDTVNFKVLNTVTRKEYPFQLEHKGKAQAQDLSVPLSVPAKETVKLILIKGKPKPVAAKTFCRYVPERKDDFAWENDKIAFRIYGKALELKFLTLILSITKLLSIQILLSPLSDKIYFNYSSKRYSPFTAIKNSLMQVNFQNRGSNTDRERDSKLLLF